MYACLTSGAISKQEAIMAEEMRTENFLSVAITMSLKDFILVSFKDE